MRIKQLSGSFLMKAKAYAWLIPVFLAAAGWMASLVNRVDAQDTRTTKLEVIMPRIEKSMDEIKEGQQETNKELNSLNRKLGNIEGRLGVRQ